MKLLNKIHLSRALIVIFSPVLLGIQFGYSQEKPFNYRKLIRRANEGFSIGINTIGIGVSGKNPLLTYPGFCWTYVGVRLYVSMDVNLFSYNSTLYYRDGTDITYKSDKKYPYAGGYYKGTAGYYIKNFIWHKATYGLMLGASWAVMAIPEVDPQKILALTGQGQNMYIKQLSTAEYFAANLQLDRYLWFGNHQAAVQICYGYTFKGNANEHAPYYFGLFDEAFYYDKQPHAVTFRLVYNLKPTVHYNPAKMTEL